MRVISAKVIYELDLWPNINYKYKLKDPKFSSIISVGSKFNDGNIHLFLHFQEIVDGVVGILCCNPIIQFKIRKQKV